MGTGRVDMSDLATLVFGLLPLLLYFNLGKLLFRVGEGTNISMLTDFFCRPVYMISRSPDF